MTSKRITPSITATGLIALDVVQFGERVWHRAGGTAANVAANLAFLGWDAQLFGLIGTDLPGRRVFGDLRARGVNLSLLKRKPDVATPIVIHKVAAAAHSYRFSCPSCGRGGHTLRPAPPSEAQRLVDSGQLGDVLFFDRPSLAALILARFQHRNEKPVVYEPSGRTANGLHFEAASLASVIKVSEDTLEHLGPLPVQPFAQLQITTRGSFGAKFRIGRGKWHNVQGYKVEVVDAGGSGDWMTAGLLNELSDGTISVKSVTHALRESQAMAALSCKLPGAGSLSDRLSSKALKRYASLIAGNAIEIDSISLKLRRASPRVDCLSCGLPLENSET